MFVAEKVRSTTWTTTLMKRLMTQDVITGQPPPR